MAKLTRPLKIGLTPADLAEAFWQMTDEEQADFFIRLHEFNPRPEAELLAIGSHLATCECATDGAREIVTDILYGMLNPSRLDVREAKKRAADRGEQWSPPHVDVPQREGD